MQESKYFYNGIPLSEYCKDNNINISTVRARIWKKKQSKKYEKYTEQEIVNIVIEAYGSAIKYMYKGISLRQYCLDNGINIGTINSRIKKLRNQNKELSNDELVILAMEEFDNKNFRFFYKGVPLKEYCESHPEINYNTIRTYINREKEKYPKSSDEELIEQYLDKEHKGIYKYYYLGIPLKQYCEENNISYKNIITYMSRYRNNDNFKELSDNEFVEKIMESYQPFEPKYLYKGLTLREYCIQNNISYYSVVSFVKRKLAKDNKKSIDELIDEGIKIINRYGIIYYYKGIPLKDYAKENNLNVSSIRCAILRKRSKSNKPLQEIIDECVESYQKFSIKYYYEGVPLITYCKSIGLNYNTVIQKYLYEYTDKTDINIDVAIKQIVDYYKKYPPIKTKYYFNNQSLTNFCNEKEYPYLAIYNRIKTLKSKDDTLDNDQIIASAIKKYEDRLKIDNIIEVFDKLKNEKISSSNEINDICEFLKIDFENVIELVNMDFSYNQAINLIWYFSDKKIDNYKIITDEEMSHIFSLINNIIRNSISIDQINLYDLIGIYKSELYDSRSEILLKQNDYVYKVMRSLCNDYKIKLSENIKEVFENEIKYYLLLVIDRINLNIEGQIIKYIDLSVKGYFRKYLKDYKENKNNKNIILSLDIINILSSFSTKDLTFIKLKYEDNYSDEELVKYLNLTPEEINQKVIELLPLLEEKKKKVIKKVICKDKKNRE